MNIMAIDLDWFLTIPGILISCGVLLLLIALIIFIVTSVKAKKEEKAKEESVENVAVDAVPAVDPVVPEAASVVPEPSVSPVTPTVSVMDDVQPATAPVVEEKAPVIDMTPIEPVTPVAENPVVTNDNVLGIPPMEPIAPIAAVEEPAAPAVAPMVEPVAPVVEPTPVTNMEDTLSNLEMPEATNLEKTSVSIYGGADPTIPPITEPEHRPIYGGADPMEATQSMRPIVEPTPVEPVVTPIIPEVTFEDTKAEDPVEEPKVVMAEAEPTYTVEQTIPPIVEEKKETVAPIPVETTENIEEL